MELVDVFIYGLKLLLISLCTYYTFIKITSQKNVGFKYISFGGIFNLIIVFICSFIKYRYGSFYSITIYYFSISILLKIVCKKRIGFSLIATMISLAICFIFLVLSVAISYIIKLMFALENRFIIFIVIALLQIIFTYGFFKINRFKSGFSFLKKQVNNMYFDVIMMNISAFIILLYGLFGAEYNNLTKNMFFLFIFFAIIMVLMIQKTLVLSYKQTLLENTIKDYEKTIKEKDEKIQRLSDEKFKINKLNHEFYNRQKSLELKVEKALKNMNFEISNEFDLGDKILELSKEYTNKVIEIKNNKELPKTDIEEIDDMFIYMQSECIKNGIEFILQINGNIHYLVNNIIDKTRLVTLIGDHLRDAIIAINHSGNKYKSILTILGIKDECYEFCIYDSGIEFEIQIFDKLGLEPVTTHKETGGTGIGFITTFETLQETDASLIIEEKNRLTENKYTKLIKFKFDNKKELKISSYRANDIKSKLKNDRFIIE